MHINTFLEQRIEKLLYKGQSYAHILSASIDRNKTPLLGYALI